MARQGKDSVKDGKHSRAQAEREITYGHALRQALEWFARNESFTDVRVHGNVGWTAVQLVVLAVLWVWSDHRRLTGAFTEACDLAMEMFGSVAVTTYQGLTGALDSYAGQLLPQIWSQFHRLMEESARPHMRVGKWLPLAVDGSRVTTPRTARNEQAFSAKNYGNGRKAKSRKKWRNKKRRSKRMSEPVKPQIWLTLIWHMCLKMPWCWKTGRSTDCERHHLAEMLQTLKFPSNTLFCGDAGFVGYALWKMVLDSGHHLLIRVGGNVRLLLKLGHARQKNGVVYLWPDEVRRGGQPPLVLRLLQFQGPRGKVYLVTSILSDSELSAKQAGQLYRLRWGVELQFRALKQTFGRRKLRSRSPEVALVELDWSLVGLWLIQLFAVKEQLKINGLPEHSSVALAMDVIQEAMRKWNCEFLEPNELICKLREATKDNYKRTSSKRARYRPDFKDKPCATKPVWFLLRWRRGGHIKRLAVLPKNS